MTAVTLEIKNFVKIPLYHTIAEINGLLVFRQKCKMVAKNGGKMIFDKKCHITLRTPWGEKFCHKRSILHCF